MQCGDIFLSTDPVEFNWNRGLQSNARYQKEQHFFNFHWYVGVYYSNFTVGSHMLLCIQIKYPHFYNILHFHLWFIKTSFLINMKWSSFSLIKIIIITTMAETPWPFNVIHIWRRHLCPFLFIFSVKISMSSIDWITGKRNTINACCSDWSIELDL